MLFISYLPGFTTDIHVNTLSGWIRKLLVMCYDTAHPFVVERMNTTTHSIRGVATSLAFRGSCEMSDLLRAGMWKSHNPFIDFYLKDVSVFQEGLYRLGPIVAAQQVVHPQRS